MTASPLPTRSTIAAKINNGVFIVLSLREPIGLTYRVLDERAVNGRTRLNLRSTRHVASRETLCSATCDARSWRYPHGLFRCWNDFCSFYLIIKYQLVLMMYGLEYALNTNVIAIA